MSFMPLSRQAEQNVMGPCTDSLETKFLIDPYMFSLLNYQNCLNLELLKNQSLIASYFTPGRDKESNCSTDKSLHSTNEHGDFSNSTHLPQPALLELPPTQIMQVRLVEPNRALVEKKVKKQKKLTSDEEYEPEKSDTENYKVAKSSESKNVPKNFSKAILLFIKRKNSSIRKIVEQEQVDFDEFMDLTVELKGKINSIGELRALWIDEGNKFAKVFRIVSNLYLRKYSFEHIFNSRVQDYSKHLKYRNKMEQVLRKPQDFTRMKDY